MSPPDTILLGDTVAIEVHALNRSGGSIPGAPLELFSDDPDTIAVVSGALAVVGLVPGRGDLIAKSGDLPSAPFRIVVK